MGGTGLESVTPSYDAWGSSRPLCTRRPRPGEAGLGTPTPTNESVHQGRQASTLAQIEAAQVEELSRRSNARDSARRSVTSFCSASARARITARSLSVDEEPARASARSRSSRTTLSSSASFRPFRSNSMIIRRDPDSDSSRSSRQPGWKLRSLRPDTPVDRPPAYAFRNSGPSTSLRMMSTAL